jgi:hypothetical protein
MRILASRPISLSRAVHTFKAITVGCGFGSGSWSTYRFYGARSNENVGMDETWKAAQGSKDGAIASLDPEVVKIHTFRTSWTGQMQGSYGLD